MLLKKGTFPSQKITRRIQFILDSLKVSGVIHTETKSYWANPVTHSVIIEGKSVSLHQSRSKFIQEIKLV